MAGDATNLWNSPEHVRFLLRAKLSAPVYLSRALDSIPPEERDPWWDRVYGLTDEDGTAHVPEDSAHLPRGCAPYLPCSVTTVRQMLAWAAVQADDVFVDIGAGTGRASALSHFLTGATAISLEIQPDLVKLSRQLARSMNADRIRTLEGDAHRLLPAVGTGTVFFLYCPFSGKRLDLLVDGLEEVAKAHPIRIGCVDLPPIRRPWLKSVTPTNQSLVVYKSTHARAA